MRILGICCLLGLVATSAGAAELSLNLAGKAPLDGLELFMEPASGEPIRGALASGPTPRASFRIASGGAWKLRCAGPWICQPISFEMPANGMVMADVADFDDKTLKLRLEGMSPGLYALLGLSLTHGQVAELACAGYPGQTINWQEVPPGGSVVLKPN